MKTKLLFLSLLCVALALAATSCSKNDGSNPSGPGQQFDKEVFWDDTHWRMMGLYGQPKTVIDEYDDKLEFNSNGMLTRCSYEDDDQVIDWMRCKYDSENRIIKLEGGLTNESVVEFEYGNHTKYVPMQSWLDTEDVLLIKGLTAMKMNNIRYEFNINNSSIQFTMPYQDVTIDYSGDFPTKMSAKYGNSLTDIGVVTFKYGKDRKFSEISESGVEDGDSYYWERTYKTENTPFMLLTLYDYGDGDVERYEYNSNGDLTKETDGDSYTYTYSNYKYDSKGNWIERKVTYKSGSYTDTETETRVITYYN